MTAPARKRVWKAWAIVAKDDGAPLWFLEHDGSLAAYKTRAEARLDVNPGECVVRVEIRELPRRGKGASRGK